MRYITEQQATTRYNNMLPRLLHVADGQGGFELFDVWTDSNSDEREKALDEATRYIDSFVYDGEKANPNQDNEFPRKGQTPLPEEVKQGCFELALFFLTEYKAKEFTDGYRAKMLQDGIDNGTITLADSSERMVFAEKKDPRKVIYPYIKRWIKGKYHITRWKY